MARAAARCRLLFSRAATVAGVSGLVAAFGEIAAGGCLAAATCTGTPPVLTTTKISASNAECALLVFLFLTRDISQIGKGLSQRQSLGSCPA